jgi:hypothetical protein
MLMELSVVEQRYCAIMEVVSRHAPVVEIAEHVERRRTLDSSAGTHELCNVSDPSHLFGNLRLKA